MRKQFSLLSISAGLNNNSDSENLAGSKRCFLSPCYTTSHSTLKTNWFSRTKICNFKTWLQKQQGIRKQLFKWHLFLFKKCILSFFWMKEGWLQRVGDYRHLQKVLISLYEIDRQKACPWNSSKKIALNKKICTCCLKRKLITKIFDDANHDQW